MSDAARPARFRPEELLAHADWARELASHLVRDAAAADDLAQDALAVAIEKPPFADRPLRPWLAAVLRKLALARRRGEARRTRREEAVGAAAASRDEPDAVEIASRLDAHRVLAEAVASLPEPLRATVFMRYYEGLDSTEIARRLRVAPETVRWRLAKALAELRTRLDARSRGVRDAWIAALIPIAAPRAAPLSVPHRSPAATTAAVLTGVIAVATTTKVILGTAAAVVLAALIWSGADKAGWTTAPGPAVETSVVEAPAGPPAERHDAAARAPRRRGATEPEAAADATPAPQAPAAENGPAREKSRVFEVRARVVDATGGPATGARVETLTAGTPSGDDGDADGRVSFEIKAADDSVSFDFAVSAVRCATRVVADAPPRDGRVLDLGDVGLSAGGTVEGRVADVDGAAVSGARVAVASPRADGSTLVEMAPVATTDAEGRFVLRGVPTGRISVYADAAGFDAKSAAADVRAGETAAGVVIVLSRVDATARVRGVVQSPDGAAVPRAMVTYRCEGRGGMGMGTITADAEGRFDIEGGRDKDWRLTARDREDRWSASPSVQVRSGASDVVLRLVETKWAEIRVTRGDDALATRYAVELRSAEGLVIARLQEDDRAEGVARLKLPAEPFVIFVTAPGCAVATAGPFEPSKVTTRIEVRAPTLPGLRGKVTLSGAPVAGARVTLRKPVPAGMREIRDGFPCLTSPTFDAGVITAADGTFELTLREAGRFVLRAETAELAPAETGPFDLVPEKGRQGIAIALTKGGSIEGRVLVAAGHDAGGVIVGVSRGDGEARTLRTGPDGAFRFDRLMAGQWIVRKSDREVRSGTSTVLSTVGEARFDWSCRVDEGATTHFDVDLRTEPGTPVKGDIRVDGAPAAGWKVTLMSGTSMLSGEESAAVNVPESGAFRVLAPGPGDYVLCARSPHGLHMFAPVKVGESEQSLTFDIAIGRVTVKNNAQDEPLALLWESASGRCALAEPGSGPDGATPMPVGRVRLVRATANERDPRRWPTVAEGDLAAGGKLELDAAAK